MKTTIKITVILALFSFSFLSASAQYTKRNTRNFISRTSYIIGEAYDMVYFYGYYSQGNLSRAVNHQNYAKFLYNMGSYRNAIYHSDLARRYALRVIYSSNNYWDNYYRPHYYPSYRPPQANRPPQGNNNNNNRPPQSNTQYGHRGSSTSITSTTRSNNGNNNNVTRTSKYASSGNDLETRDFDTWEQNYYSKEELSIIGNSSRPSERELETAVNNNSSIRRVSSDDEVMKNGINDFSNDINTFKKSHQEEAKTMAISRPSDFGTTTEVTRSTANRTSTSTSTNTSPTRQTQTATPTQTQTSTPTRNTSTQTTRPTQTQTTTPTRNTSTSTQTTVPKQNQTTPKRNTSTQTTTPTRNSTTATQNKAAEPASTNKATQTRSTQTTNQNRSTNTTQTRSTSTNQNTQKESTATQKSNTNTRSR